MKRKNPLYVVTNKGKDVHATSGAFEAILKKLGLDGIYEFLMAMLDTFIQQFSGYMGLKMANEFLENAVNIMEELGKKIFPSAFIYRT